MAMRPAPRRGGSSKDIGHARSEKVDNRAPMTEAQVAELRRLAEATFEPDAFSTNLTFRQAALRIAVLYAKLGKQGLPPHTL